MTFITTERLMSQRSKIIGSTLILTGTAIGAGMLALPLVSESMGFPHSAILMVIMWALMLTTAMLVLEVNLACPVRKNSFHSMAKKTLGMPGQVVAWVTCLLLLYALTAAYMNGAGSLVSGFLNEYSNYHIPQYVSAIAFTLVFGGIVTWHTRAVDLFNRTFMSIKGIALIVMLVSLMPHINWVLLMRNHHSDHLLLAAAPVFLTAFGFHTSIPSLSNYLNADKSAMKKVIIWGATIPFVFYLIWLMCSLGVVPLTGSHGFNAQVAGHSGQVHLFVALMTKIAHSHWATVGVNTFSNVAMTTSFLGVTLGLFDFLADGLKRKNTGFGRIQTGLLTFVLPLIVAIFFAKGFVIALTYAAIFVAILLVILPALMAYSLRRNPAHQSPLRVVGGTPLLFVVLVFGIAMTVISIFYH